MDIGLSLSLGIGYTLLPRTATATAGSHHSEEESWKTTSVLLKLKGKSE